MRVLARPRILALVLLLPPPCAAAQSGMPGSPHPAMAGMDRIVELRQYTLLPGKRDVLVDLFEAEFVESQEARGRTPDSTRTIAFALQRARPRRRQV